VKASCADLKCKPLVYTCYWYCSNLHLLN